MSDTRTQRDNQSRENTARPSDKWFPPTNLPIPEDTEHWKFRWIRTSMMGTADNANVSARFREGWVACKTEDHEDLRLIPDRGSQYQGNIEIGGLLLCKIPMEIVRQRRAYYQQAAQRQMDSVDSNFMNENDPRMPVFTENQSRKSFQK